MRAAPILLVLSLVLAAGCGSVRDQSRSGRAPAAPAGRSCARTPDGDVCWPDAVAPSLSAVSATCGTPCLRDAALRIEATLADDAEVGSAEVSLGARRGRHGAARR